MEWMNRAGRPAQHPGQTVTPASAAPTGGTHHTNNSKRSKKDFGFHHIASGVLFFSVAVLAAALVGFFLFYKGQNSEGKYIAKDNYQAVFLNGGQVYFGKVRALNSSYVGMTDIYYLRVNQQVQPKEGEQAQQDISLVKLGCELHGPQDQMFINRDQVVFWENLKPDGKVAKAVEAYVKANPGEQKCENPQQSSQPASQEENKDNSNESAN